MSNSPHHLHRMYAKGLYIHGVGMLIPLTFPPHPTPPPTPSKHTPSRRMRKVLPINPNTVLILCVEAGTGDQEV